jgi:hypothetical protein
VNIWALVNSSHLTAVLYVNPGCNSLREHKAISGCDRVTFLFYFFLAGPASKRNSKLSWGTWRQPILVVSQAHVSPLLQNRYSIYFEAQYIPMAERLEMKCDSPSDSITGGLFCPCTPRTCEEEEEKYWNYLWQENKMHLSCFQAGAVQSAINHLVLQEAKIFKCVTSMWRHSILPKSSSLNIQIYDNNLTKLTLLQEIASCFIYQHHGN